MSEKETKTVFIAGYELDAGVVRILIDAALPSVQRVVEALAIGGKDDLVVKTAAKTTAEAVVITMVELLQSKVNPVDQAASMSPGDRSGREDLPSPEAQ